MTKKFILVFILITLFAVKVSAEFKISIGYGILAGGDLRGNGAEVTVKEAGSSLKHERAIYNFGTYGFFDAYYVEASLGFMYSIVSYPFYFYNHNYHSNPLFVNFHFQLLGKFPFVINNRLIIFPAVGVDYQWFLNGYRDSIYDHLSHFNIKMGIGLDFFPRKSLFLRTTLLYGLRLDNKFTDELTKELDRFAGGTVTRLMGHGLQGRFAVGHRF